MTFPLETLPFLCFEVLKFYIKGFFSLALKYFRAGEKDTPYNAFHRIYAKSQLSIYRIMKKDSSSENIALEN